MVLILMFIFLKNRLICCTRSLVFLCPLDLKARENECEEQEGGVLVMWRRNFTKPVRLQRRGVSMIERLKPIQTCFNKASASYDDVAFVQKRAARFLVDRILRHQNFIPQTILDVGTGTGYIPELLFKQFPTSSFYLNDIADEMLEVCKIKFAQTQNIYYLPGDMLALNADFYDCVVSNFALQWSTDGSFAIHKLHSKSLNIFAFSMLLDGTFAEWNRIVNQYQSVQILNYPKAQALMSLCNTLKRNDQVFECWQRDAPVSFNHPISFMRYLKSLGASAPGHLVHPSRLKKLIQSEAQSLTVTYKIFFGMFRKVDS